MSSCVLNRILDANGWEWCPDAVFVSVLFAAGLWLMLLMAEETVFDWIRDGMSNLSCWMTLAAVLFTVIVAPVVITLIWGDEAGIEFCDYSSRHLMTDFLFPLMEGIVWTLTAPFRYPITTIVLTGCAFGFVYARDTLFPLIMFLRTL